MDDDARPVVHDAPRMMRRPTDRTRLCAGAVLLIATVIAGCGGPPPTQSASPASTVPGTPSPSGPAVATPAASPGTATVPPAPQGSPLPSPAATIVVAEVLYDPLPSASAFVEIANPSNVRVDLTGISVRVSGRDIALADPGGSLAAGERLLLDLDDAGANVGRKDGFVELADRAGKRIDRVAWGSSPDAVEKGPGGLVPDSVPRGSSIGRAPGADRPSERLDWVVYPPTMVTPGAANPLPRVEVLLPMDGAVLDAADMTLAWYAVTGATSYRLQIATDRSFADPIEDRVVVDAEATLGRLPPRAYLWRVASIADGVEAGYSDPHGFTVDDGSDAAASPAAMFVEAGFAPAAVVGPARRLTVPYLTQHKDTKLLLLESENEKGAHAWDVDHGVYGHRDPADRKNCAFAAVAMMNRFFRGDMSQDRLGYELFSGRETGPEKDLNYGTGISVPQATSLLAYALQTTPRDEIGYLDYDDAWADITASIDAGRPLMAANTHHTLVVTGYQETAAGRVFWYHDPANGRDRRLNIDTTRFSPNDLTLWIVPPGSSGRRQEAGVIADSDGDRVRDFDETVRFHTNPGDQDTDQDKLDDYYDIVTGVYDSRHGYAFGWSGGRDWDSDGLPTERDKDSDEGGCWDGEEDTSGDGHRNGDETDNFDIDDDPCIKYDITIIWLESWNGNVDRFEFKGEAGNIEPSADESSIFLTGAGTVAGARVGWAACSVNMEVPRGSGPAFFGATIVGDTVTVSAFGMVNGVSTEPFEMPKDGGTRDFASRGSGGSDLCPYSWEATVVVEKLPGH